MTARLRERGRDGCLAGIQVQQLFCSNNTTIPEHQLKELNIKIDNALQVQSKPGNQATRPCNSSHHEYNMHRGLKKKKAGSAELMFL